MINNRSITVNFGILGIIFLILKYLGVWSFGAWSIWWFFLPIVPIAVELFTHVH